MNAISKKGDDEKKLAPLRPAALQNSLDLDLNRQIRVLWAQRTLILLGIIIVLVLTWALISTRNHLSSWAALMRFSPPACCSTFDATHRFRVNLP